MWGLSLGREKQDNHNSPQSDSRHVSADVCRRSWKRGVVIFYCLSLTPLLLCTDSIEPAITSLSFDE